MSAPAQSWDGPTVPTVLSCAHCAHFAHCTHFAFLTDCNAELCLSMDNHILEANLTACNVLKPGYSFANLVSHPVRGKEQILEDFFPIILKFLERCIVHCNLDLKPPPSCSFVGFHFRNPIQGWERWDSTQDLRPLDESNKQKTGLGWGRMGGSSHLAFIFPQFQDHPTKTQQGT